MGTTGKVSAGRVGVVDLLVSAIQFQFSKQSEDNLMKRKPIKTMIDLEDGKLYSVEINGKRQVAKFYETMAILNGCSGFEFHNSKGRAAGITLGLVSNIEEVDAGNQE